MNSVAFNSITCCCNYLLPKPEAPATACYETATFDGETCKWSVTGEQPEAPITKCNETASFNEETCAWVITETALPNAGEDSNLAVCSGIVPTESELLMLLELHQTKVVYGLAQ